MDMKYTAQDMRQVAKSFLSSEVNLDFDKRDIAAMLRQAADMMDQERKYEYARVLSDGSISCTHFDEYAKGYYKFRREVGKWEEVSQ